MANPILKEMTVPIPEDGSVVIRNGKRVEYQLERIYSPETKDSRVKRQVIGKVDPVQPGRMFPNEFYFELFPDNEVPEDVREEFLRECAIKRQMHVIRQSPEEIVDNVIRGLDQLGGLSDRPPTPLRAEYFSEGDGMNYTMLRRVFDEIYYAVEELAGKYPNEVIVPFKVERINEVLEALRGSIDDEKIKPFLRLIEEGLTYSDVLLMMKWYKVLPR
jgi:hypothetical protein